MAGISAVAMVLGASSAAAAAKSAPGANLVIKIKAIKQLPGDPPYITLDESARAPGFVVTFSVQNKGGRASGKAVIALALEQKGRSKWFKDDFIELRAHSKPKTVSWKVDNLRADLGFLTPTATVKWATTNKHQRSDSDSADPIPVIARDWNVSSFQTRINVGGTGPSGQTQADGKLMYRFSSFDEADKEFVYKPYGQLTNQARYNGGGCSGSASESKDMGLSPWPGDTSELMIKGSLTQYNAGVEARDQPAVNVNVTCPTLGNFSFPVQVPWENLETFNGSPNFPRMSPDQTTLTGQGSKMTPVGELKFLWTFNARLSGA